MEKDAAKEIAKPDVSGEKGGVGMVGGLEGLAAGFKALATGEASTSAEKVGLPSATDLLGPVGSKSGQGQDNRQPGPSSEQIGDTTTPSNPPPRRRGHH